MRSLTCAFLSVGLVLATCAGCGSGSATTKPGSGGPPVPPGVNVGDMSEGTETTAPLTATDARAAEIRKEGGEEKATEKPADAKPADDKKTDENKPAEEKPAGEKKSDEKKPDETKPEEK